jgi:DNA-binding transcriptional LysR family regulator
MDSPCRGAMARSGSLVMELAHIKYFLAVCKAQHFTRAAALCGISQPSLSVAIRRLEEELGGPLFDRGPPVRLSPLGEAVKPHFRTIWRKVARIQRIAEAWAPECTRCRSHGRTQRTQQIPFAAPQTQPSGGVRHFLDV